MSPEHGAHSEEAMAIGATSRTFLLLAFAVLNLAPAAAAAQAYPSKPIRFIAPSDISAA